MSRQHKNTQNTVHNSMKAPFKKIDYIDIFKRYTNKKDIVISNRPKGGVSVKSDPSFCAPRYIHS
jgi:hypothetical protein